MGRGDRESVDDDNAPPTRYIRSPGKWRNWAILLNRGEALISIPERDADPSSDTIVIKVWRSKSLAGAWHCVELMEVRRVARAK